jgi:extradiol dioxygenase family protein
VHPPSVTGRGSVSCAGRKPGRRATGAALASLAVEPILHLSIPVTDLDSARAFYVDTLGCSPGYKGADGMDVWFFGLQLTLQLRPDEVLGVDRQGTRHFGVTLDRAALDALLTRLQNLPVRWVSPVSTDTVGVLRGKTSAKVADPSGNVIEFKAYDDPYSALGAPPR